MVRPQRPPSPVARRRTTDVIKLVIVVSLCLASIGTVERLQYFQAVLDGLINNVPASQRHMTTWSMSDIEGTCLLHAPIEISDARNLDESRSQRSVISQPTLACGTLRRNWLRNPVRSPLAKQIEAQQNNCSLPAAYYHVDDSFGFGSHLNVWSQAMCNAMEASQRVQSYNPTWIWMDQTYCSAEQAERSPLLCYFPLSEDRCPNKPQLSWPYALNITRPKNKDSRCALVREPGMLSSFRAASMEFLFQSLSPLIIQEAQRQLGALFGPSMQAPADLITVHMRWGDKFWEMDLVHENEYVAAVSQLLLASGRPDNQTANVYLATEDPRAVEAFRKAAPSGWTIYVDRTIAEINEYRPEKGNRASWAAKNTRGRAGLVALGSLLVALEANYFVVTTKSNWSRLMEQLRKTIIDPNCGNCTMSIDLAPGEW